MDSTVRMLGPLRLEVDGRVIPVRSAQQRAVLALLAWNAGHSVSMDRLVSALWVHPPPRAVNAVQVQVSGLRRVMGDSAGAGAQSRLITTVGGGYAWTGSPESVDSRVFDRMVQRGEAEQAQGRQAAALEAFDRALGLWRDPPLADVGDPPFKAALVQSLEDRWLDAASGRAAARTALGHAGLAVVDLRPLVLERPGDERLAGALMSALAGAGESAEALRVFANLRETLADELGTDPSPQLQLMHRDLLLQGVPARVKPPSVMNHSEPASAPEPSQNDRELIGRDREVVELVALIRRDGRRLVCVTGTAGTGKTRVCAAVARELENDFPDGVLHIGLANVQDPIGLLAEIQAAADLPSDSTPPDARRLAQALKGRRLLLVIDDFEHLVSAATLLSELLRQAPDCSALLSTRVRLHVSGEYSYRLHPLELPRAGAGIEEILASPAVRLFCERAAAASGFRPGVPDVVDLVRVCTRLDGLPLALELAAARTTIYALPTLLARLDDCFAVLTGGPRDVPAHQRALRATLEWSTTLLDATAVRVFAELSMFPGSWTLAAVAQVMDLESDVVRDVITSLLDNSLVQPAGPDRFIMLTVVREFARTMLAADQVLSTRSMVADWAVQVSVTLQRGREDGSLTKSEWAAIFQSEETNLVSAVDWCVQQQDPRAVTLLGNLWYFSFFEGTTFRWTNWIHARLPTGSATPDEQYRLARALGGIALTHFADPRRAVEHYQEALAGMPLETHDVERAILRHNQAIALRFGGDLLAARKGLEDVLASSVGTLQQFGDELTELAEIYEELGEHDLAADALRRCLERPVEIDQETTAYIFAGQAMGMCQEDPAYTRLCLTQLRDTSHHLTPVVSVDVQHMAAIVHVVLGGHDEAWALLRDNLQAMSQTGYYLFALDTAVLAAVLLQRRGDVQRSVVLANHAGRLRSSLGLFMAYRPLRQLHEDLLAEQKYENRPRGAAQGVGDVESLVDLIQLTQAYAAQSASPPGGLGPFPVDS